MSLTTYSLAELKKLNLQIAREIDRRQSQTKSDVLKQMNKLAMQAGLRLEDVFTDVDVSAQRQLRPKRPGTAPAARAKTKVALKYRHPSDGSLTWSGRGRKPLWVCAWLNDGRSLDGLAIAATR